MAHAKLDDQELTTRAAELFRQNGFAGTSMSDISGSCGIEKASLYYRFPGGKDELALAAATHIDAWFSKHVLAPLQGESPPAARLKTSLRKLREFYADGEKPCILDTLSLPGRNEAVALALRDSLAGWLSAFAAIARESGLRHDVAARRAEQAIISIEGALVLSRVLGSGRPFQRAVSGIPALLLKD